MQAVEIKQGFFLNSLNSCRSICTQRIGKPSCGFLAGKSRHPKFTNEEVIYTHTPLFKLIKLN